MGSFFCFNVGIYIYIKTFPSKYYSVSIPQVCIFVICFTFNLKHFLLPFVILLGHISYLEVFWQFVQFLFVHNPLYPYWLLFSLLYSYRTYSYIPLKNINSLNLWITVWLGTQSGLKNVLSVLENKLYSVGVECLMRYLLGLFFQVFYFIYVCVCVFVCVV